MNKNTQPKRRSHATVIAAFTTAIEEVKRLTSNQTPQLIVVKPLQNKHKVGSSFFPALVNAGLVTIHPSPDGRTGHKAPKAYQWVNGIENYDVETIHKNYCELETKRKAGHKPKLKNKDEVPHIVHHVKSADMPNKKKSEEKTIKGTLFGYRQLEFMGETYSKKPMSILINDQYSIEGVQLIKYNIDKSKLLVEFFMYANREHEPDNTSLIGSVKLENSVLSFQKAFESDASNNLKMYTVPVKDPYNLKNGND